jgi:hypothetical protein
MRLSALVFTAILAAAPVWAQTSASSSSADQSSAPQDYNLPVNLDKIRAMLEQPTAPTLRGLNEVPTFKVEIQEKQKLEELVAAIFKDVKKVPVPAGGIYMQEMQRQWWPSVDNPLMQPYAAFSQGQLATIVIENIVGRLLAGPAMRALSSAERAIAENAAREEVRRTILEYCAAQPNQGAGIQICRPSI